MRLILNRRMWRSYLSDFCRLRYDLEYLRLTTNYVIGSESLCGLFPKDIVQDFLPLFREEIGSTVEFDLPMYGFKIPDMT